ncbi:MAG: hypothetical protein WC614_12635 [bacterium]
MVGLFIQIAILSVKFSTCLEGNIGNISSSAMGSNIAIPMTNSFRWTINPFVLSGKSSSRDYIVNDEMGNPIVELTNMRILYTLYGVNFGLRLDRGGYFIGFGCGIAYCNVSHSEEEAYYNGYFSGGVPIEGSEIIPCFNVKCGIYPFKLPFEVKMGIIGGMNFAYSSIGVNSGVNLGGITLGLAFQIDL